MIPGQTQSFLAGYARGCEVAQEEIDAARAEGYKEGYEKALAIAEIERKRELENKRELIGRILNGE